MLFWATKGMKLPMLLDRREKLFAAVHLPLTKDVDSVCGGNELDDVHKNPKAVQTKTAPTTMPKAMARKRFVFTTFY